MPGSNSNCSRALSSRLEKVLNVNSGLTKPNKTEHAGIGEGGKRRVFRQADAGRLEGPLKGVKHRDAGDRD